MHFPPPRNGPCVRMMIPKGDVLAGFTPSGRTGMLGEEPWARGWIPGVSNQHGDRQAMNQHGQALGQKPPELLLC